MGARTRNTYRAAAVAFANWCVSTNRLIANSFQQTPVADEGADKRRQRRAMSEGELQRLLYVARLRPLAECGRSVVRRTGDDAAGHKSWKSGELTLETMQAAVDLARDRLLRPKRSEKKPNPALIASRELLGRERALIYKTMVLTGLRRGELKSLTVGQLHLNDQTPYLDLAAADEKNREGSKIPLRAELANELAAWIADRSSPLPHDAPLFTVPRDLVRILDRDLAAAGIPKRDDRGRTLDVHALRHSFGTLLSVGGSDAPHSPGCHASFVGQPDHERVHRPPAAGRGRRTRFASSTAPRCGSARGCCECRSAKVCTRVCTET